MTTPCFDSVILSDLHLGSEVSRAEAALQTLKAISFRRLILWGDIFCDLNFRRLKKEHWRFLSYIRKLSNPKRRVEVVWVEGNHDYGLSDVMSHLVGIEVYQEYQWNYRGIRHLAIHGHQFDRLLVNNRFLSSFLTGFHHGLQKVSFGHKRIVGFLERFDAVWLRLSAKVDAEALAHGRARSARPCGHSLRPFHRRGYRTFRSDSGAEGCGINETQEPALRHDQYCLPDGIGLGPHPVLGQQSYAAIVASLQAVQYGHVHAL